MRGQWQPYPYHPQIQELTQLLADLPERVIQALAEGNSLAVRRLLDERVAAQERLEELTAALLRNTYLSPRWVGHTEADAAAGGIPCLGCGNNIPAGESRCSYCDWTYRAEPVDEQWPRR